MYPTSEEIEADPSLSSYETLAESLFARIREGTLHDASALTDEQKDKYGLKGSPEGDLLWKGNLLYVPGYMKLRNDILYWHHDVPWCGHLGIQKTLNLVQRQFWWPGITTDIKNYVQSCYNCQSDKPDRRRRRPPLTLIQSPSSCWRTIGVDLITDLTPTEEGGFNAIVVFCCHLSKMCRLIATHTTLTTQGFVKLFFKEVFPHYGFPTKIVSDRGQQWNSEFFRALCDAADIRLSLSTAYHPQTNGLVERTNEVVETALRHYVGATHTNWNEKLSFVEFALNDMYHETTGTTAFRMNRVTVPLSPFEAVKKRIAHKEGITEPNAEVASWVGMSTPGARTLVQAHEEFARARRSVHWAKCKMKESYDKKGVVRHYYNRGDPVWLSTRNIRIRHPSLRHKFSPKFVGPVQVLEASENGSTVLLDLPASLQIHPRVSVALVKPYKQREGVETIPVWVDGAEEWEVEAITDHHVERARSKAKQGTVEFRIQWKGHAEPSWHEFTDCEHSIDLVQKYLGSCTKQVRSQIYKVLRPTEKEWLTGVYKQEALSV